MIISGLPVSYEGIELHLQVEDVGPWIPVKGSNPCMVRF